MSAKQHHDIGYQKRRRNALLNPLPLTSQQRREARSGIRVYRTYRSRLEGDRWER